MEVAPESSSYDGSDGSGPVSMSSGAIVGVAIGIIGALVLLVAR